MNYYKTLLSIIGMAIVSMYTYSAYQHAHELMNLRKEGKRIIQAEIIKLTCGSKDYITLKINGEQTQERIYLSSAECDELRTKTKIGVKMDEKNNFVFADDTFNDDAEAEMVAIMILGIFINLILLYYGIIAGLRKSQKS